MDAEFCVEALKDALAKHGTPEIFNTDQGSQFTSGDWIDVLTDAKVKISMDGKERWIDNRMIERLWRSLKYECVYLHAFEKGSEAKSGIGKWLVYYNVERPYSTHGILPPDEALCQQNRTNEISGLRQKPRSTSPRLQTGRKNRTTSHYGHGCRLFENYKVIHIFKSRKEVAW